VSNPFAISAVTAAFSQLLKRVATEEPTLAGATVTNERPFDATEAGRRLNLFLYQITPNPALRNADLPFRDRNGTLTRRPMVALNLSYLLTAFGKSDDEIDAHHLLAHGMSIVHDNAVLTRQHIRDSVAAFPGFPELVRSDLADQIEPVKITPLQMTQEEHFKLWSTFSVPYRLSVGYEASLVMVERPLQPRAPAPRVHTRGLLTVPFRRPRISSVEPAVATVGETLTLRGSQLKGGTVRVAFESGEENPASVEDEVVTALVPTALRAGVQTLRLVQREPFGQPPTPRRVFESNPVAFMVAPRITTASPVKVKIQKNPQGQLVDTDMALAVTPSVAKAQPTRLIAGERTLNRKVLPGDPPAGTNLTFTVPKDFPPGTYLLRVVVDGADSPLTVTSDAHGPRYSGPLLEVSV
jgi:uncharacterized protein DUF4255